MHRAWNKPNTMTRDIFSSIHFMVEWVKQLLWVCVFFESLSVFCKMRLRSVDHITPECKGGISTSLMWKANYAHEGALYWHGNSLLAMKVLHLEFFSLLWLAPIFRKLSATCLSCLGEPERDGYSPHMMAMGTGVVTVICRGPLWGPWAAIPWCWPVIPALST